MAKKETKETDLVSVEMTEEQKEEFIAFQLQKEKEATKQTTDEGFARINLFAKHSFGRQTYGPGWAKVPAGLAGQIVYQDQKAQGREIALNTTNKRLVQVMMNSGQAIEMTKK